MKIRFISIYDLVCARTQEKHHSKCKHIPILNPSDAVFGNNADIPHYCAHVYQNRLFNSVPFFRSLQPRFLHFLPSALHSLPSLVTGLHAFIIPVSFFSVTLCSAFHMQSGFYIQFRIQFMLFNALRIDYKLTSIVLFGFVLQRLHH